MTKSTKSHLRGRILLKIFSGLVAQTSANCPVGQLHNSLILYARDYRTSEKDRLRDFKLLRIGGGGGLFLLPPCSSFLSIQIYT